MAALIVALIAFAVCVEPAHAAIRVVDDAGTAVALQAPARRIVALAPSATELVFAAGAGNRLVGVVAGSDFPAEARKLPVIGDAHAVDLERIVALMPDVVVTWPYTTPAQAEQLRSRGIAVRETADVVEALADGAGVRLETETASYHTPLVIGADGSGSLIRRRLVDPSKGATARVSGRRKQEDDGTGSGGSVGEARL